MLRTRLFKYFGVLVISLGVLSAILGVSIIRTQIIDRAQMQVRMDLNSAWSVLNSNLENLETILSLTVERPDFDSAFKMQDREDLELKNKLEKIRMKYGLDFLSIMTPQGRVVLRSAPPYNTGDYFLSKPAFQTAVKGEKVTGLTLFEDYRLNREHGNLAEKAFMVREKTPRARPSERDVESRGMVTLSAVPVVHNNRVVAVLYGGNLLNRNSEIVESIQESVYKKDKHNKTPRGTVTIFLHDCRITTTVMRDNGQRALGTLVSKEVADRVLDNSLPWIGRAFVVNDWYLTAYDPVKATDGEVIGMLYVGILEEPFKETIRAMIFRFAALSLAGVAVTLVLAFLIAGYVAKPLHALAYAANEMRRGERPPEVTAPRASTETKTLINTFNGMASELMDKQERLKEMNGSLTALNRSYMETLGFISHELKTPLGSIMNYIYLLREMKFGQMNERQQMAVKNIDMNTKRITEMVRHYLNLSRVENGDLSPSMTKLEVVEDIVGPLLDNLSIEIEEKDMKIHNRIDPGLLINADYNMTLEVFENMISNAIKYGYENGEIRLKAERTDKGMIRFAVWNEGEGIAPEDHEKLFDKFTRLYTKDGKKKRGTGLGLFITRHIVRAHGGEISVRSEQGGWTEFEFTLPEYIERKENEHINSGNDGKEQQKRSNMETVRK